MLKREGILPEEGGGSWERDKGLLPLFPVIPIKQSSSYPAALYQS